MKSLNFYIGQFIKHLGYEINSFPNGEELLIRNEFIRNKIDVVFDIGANIGQYADYLRQGQRYRNKIVSFEPLLQEYTVLSAKAKKDKQWITVNAGCGESTKTVTINRAGNSQSSSLLNMLERHKAAAPASSFTGVEEIKLLRLDEVAYEYCRVTDNIFVKIDVQGYEKNVLDGGAAFIQTVKGVQLELSLKPLYENEMLYSDMISYMEERGFYLFTLSPGFRDTKNNELLQIDAVFFKHT